MLKALALKELRETIGIAAVALILFAYFVIVAIGVTLLPWDYGYEDSIPFVAGPVKMNFTLVAGLLAIALGFRQTTWETAFGSAQFLLHRPVARWRLVGVKLAVGAAVLMLSSALPILVYALWAATPGTHASPFEWSMTIPFWQMPVVMTIVYLGSFLSGIRPARWVGTRLAPLASAAFLASVVTLLPCAWGWSLLLVLAVDGLLIASVFFAIQTRDF